MMGMYGVDEASDLWRQKAATLAAEVIARHAADVDAQGRFPVESMAALTTQGFYGLCTDRRFGG